MFLEYYLSEICRNITASKLFNIRLWRPNVSQSIQVQDWTRAMHTAHEAGESAGCETDLVTYNSCLPGPAATHSTAQGTQAAAWLTFSQLSWFCPDSHRCELTTPFYPIVVCKICPPLSQWYICCWLLSEQRILNWSESAVIACIDRWAA